jgi:CBS domain containing-hemolysin-like protein
LFTSSPVDELPVTDDSSGSLVGIIRKKDLIVAYNDELLKRKGITRSTGKKGSAPRVQ